MRNKESQYFRGAIGAWEGHVPGAPESYAGEYTKGKYAARRAPWGTVATPLLAVTLAGCFHKTREGISIFQTDSTQGAGIAAGQIGMMTSILAGLLVLASTNDDDNTAAAEVSPPPRHLPMIRW